jgi:hypothetical protein
MCRKSSIANEWKISTKAELLSKDVLLSALIQVGRSKHHAIVDSMKYVNRIVKMCKWK